MRVRKPPGRIRCELHGRFFAAHSQHALAERLLAPIAREGIAPAASFLQGIGYGRTAP